MTLTDLKRLSDVELAEIARRLMSPMNDDGYRAWYRQDINRMMEEILALRRERATALGLLGCGPADSLVDAVTDYVESKRSRKRV